MAVSRGTVSTYVVCATTADNSVVFDRVVRYLVYLPTYVVREKAVLNGQFMYRIIISLLNPIIRSLEVPTLGT